MISTWQRYYFKELLKVFTLFISAFYFLYVLIDFSAHTKTFSGLGFSNVTLYYLYQFTKRADILIPVALLLGTIKVLTTSTLRHENVALVTGGVRLKTLMHPFLLAALICSSLLLLNYQLLQPTSLSRLNAFEELYFRDRASEPKIHSLRLEDNSLLLYQTYVPQTKALHDTFWLKSQHDLFRIKTLYPQNKIPLGEFVDHITLSEKEGYERHESFEELFFPTMHFNPKSLFAALHPPRWQSISQLATTLPWRKIGLGLGKMSDREAQSITFFFYKLTMPLLCLLVVIAPAPYCLRFGRSLPVFFIYAFSLFGFISFFTLVNASVILGESQVIPPIWAVSLPPALAFLLFGARYAKL